EPDPWPRRPRRHDQAPAALREGRRRRALRAGAARPRDHEAGRLVSRQADQRGMSAADPALTAAEMEAVGVRRLSVGGALSRLALAAFMKGARETKDKGGFTWVNETIATRDL